MKHEMRRFKQQLSEAKVIEILNSCTNGVLSLVDSDGEPYGVPISYVYDGDGHIYFHCALTGHKINCINSDSRCSFCVVAQDLIMPEKFTTYFRSVIVTGEIHMVTDADEIQRGLLLLGQKYSPGVDPTDEIARCRKHIAVLRLDIAKATGKEAIELVSQGI